MGTSGTCIFGRTNYKRPDYQNIIANRLHQYIISVFRYGNCSFEQENTSCRMTGVGLNLIHDPNFEFQLTCQSPNSTDHNPIGLIFGAIQRHRKAPKHSSQNMTGMFDCRLNILINLRSSTNHLWNICQGVLQLFCLLNISQHVIRQVVKIFWYLSVYAI